MKKFFQVLEKSKKSQARLGKIQTEHGVIKTPAFVPVATKGTVKSLTPKQIKEIGVQVSFVNTYHLVTYPGVDIIEKSGGIHQMAKLDYPLMSDSGGFQVFSLAKQNHKSQTSNPQEKSCLPAGRSNSKIQKTDLFIFPPYNFKMTDILITNFHLPKSSLMMLVEAFLEDKYKKAPPSLRLRRAKQKTLVELYQIAIKNHFRFYSFGDAMLII